MILFIETASTTGGLLLYDPIQDSYSCQSWTAASSHSERITFEFERMLEESQLPMSSIDLVVVNVGPGSFTGLRVGLSFARTLSYLLQCEVLSLNTLEVMAQTSPLQGKILVSLPAVTGHHYVAGFEKLTDRLSLELAPQSFSNEELKKSVDLFDHFIQAMDQNPPTKVEDLLDFYRQKSRAFQKNSWKEVMPLYLRRSQAEEKLSVGILKPLYDESGKSVESSGQKQGGRS